MPWGGIYSVLLLPISTGGLPLTPCRYYDPMTVNTNLCPAWQTLKDEMVTSPDWLDVRRNQHHAVSFQ